MFVIFGSIALGEPRIDGRLRMCGSSRLLLLSGNSPGSRTSVHDKERN